MLTVSSLAKSFATADGEVRAVDGVSFSVPEAQCYVLLGPSGCGKTTILRCVAGLEQANRGVIAIGGRVVSDVAKGLFVPVLRDTDTKSFAQIEKDILDYANKAKEGKITIDDLQGGVFSISNGGTYGSLLSTPILNPPQSGILGMHTIQQRPVAVNGQVVIRPMMYLALSYDHRIVDGKEAVTFLIRIKDALEAPHRLLLEL